MATQAPASNPDLAMGPTANATATAPITPLAVKVLGDDTESSNNDNSRSNNSREARDEKKTGGGIPDFKPTPRFWAILVTCSIISLLSALENTVVTTALPQIVAELDMGENYIWITNVFFLTSAAFQPLMGQLADIYGRRWVTMAIVAFFTIGSVVSGATTSGAMLIAGRAIQGIGSGGINIINEIIVSDLVPLRLRGNYMAAILVIYTVGLAIGPWVGGVIVERTTWRWVFYLTVPIGGASMIMIFLFLRTAYNRSESHLQKLARIDYAGNLILIASTVAILYATTYGGLIYPWSSAQILSPLVIGLAGFVLFGFYETKAKDPVVPPNLFGSRTSVIVFVATFLNSVLVYWVLFFLPVYFQVVLGASPSQSGVDILPTMLFVLPGSIAAVLMLARWGEYKILHIVGFGVAVIGSGIFTLLDRNTTTAQWAVYQMVQALGVGFVLNTLLPAAQAQLPESYQAATTSAWAFTRSFGSIWGVAVPAAIFNNRFAQLVWRIEDPAVRALFHGGNQAYQNAYASFVWSFPEVTRDQIISVYSDALKLMWQISVVFAGVNFIIVLFERRVPLRTELETEFGLEEKEKKSHGETAASA